MIDAAQKPPDTKKPKKPTVKYIDLPIVSTTPSMSKTELDGAHEIEVTYLCIVGVTCSKQVSNSTLCLPIKVPLMWLEEWEK
jgi:hypothetical protein